MKTFAGNRPLEEVKRRAVELGYMLDTSDFDKGSDFIWLRDMKTRMLQVKYNTFNGCFVVWAPVSERPIATEASVDKEGTPWYDELLTVFYREEDVAHDTAH